MMYPHATDNSPRPIINDSGKKFQTFYKMSNLKMNTVIDFQIYFFGKSNGFMELHIKYLEWFFLHISEKHETKDRLLQGR